MIAALEKVLKKHKLGTDRRQNWERIQRKEKKVNGLLQTLRAKRSELNEQLIMLSINSQGRVENEILPDVLKRMDEIAKRRSTSHISLSSDMTTYDDDDKEVWRQFRRDLLRSRIRSSDIKKYSPELKLYLRRLQQQSEHLDADAPESYRARYIYLCVMNFSYQPVTSNSF